MAIANFSFFCVVRFHGPVEGGELRLKKALEGISGAMFQWPPLISAVNRVLCVRAAKLSQLIKFDEARNLAVFEVACEAGTYIRTLCVHLGLWLGCGAHMQELRRTKSGEWAEELSSRCTRHDLLDAIWLAKMGNEVVLREVFQPLESMLTTFPHMIIKDMTKRSTWAETWGYSGEYRFSTKSTAQFPPSATALSSGRAWFAPVSSPRDIPSMPAVLMLIQDKVRWGLVQRRGRGLDDRDQRRQYRPGPPELWLLPSGFVHVSSSFSLQVNIRDLSNDYRSGNSYGNLDVPQENDSTSKWEMTFKSILKELLHERKKCTEWIRK